MSTNQEEGRGEAASAGPPADDPDQPNPATGVGIGAGEPSSFEPEEPGTAS
jgi:hypothetical protein